MWQMTLPKQVLKITFITALHHVKWQFVIVMVWQAYRTDKSNTNLLNKLLAFLFYFQKMKVGLSNHQPVLSVSLCAPH
jgi:hypothetical protein